MSDFVMWPYYLWVILHQVNPAVTIIAGSALMVCLIVSVVKAIKQLPQDEEKRK